MSFDFDATVVGAGAVGLACGRALSKRGLTLHDGGRGLFVVCNWGVQTTELFFNTF